MADTTHPSSSRKIWYILANLNPFGFGYLLAGFTKRWLIFLAGGLLLLITGQVLNASLNTLLWAGIFAGWMVAMAIDLGLLLRKISPAPLKFLERMHVLLPLIAILLFVLFAGGFTFYRLQGTNLIQDAQMAVDQGKYDGALADLKTFSSTYRLSLNPVMKTIPTLTAEIDALQEIDSRLADGDYEQALQVIRDYLADHPSSARQSALNDQAVNAWLGWVDQLVEQKQFESALEKLDTLNAGYPAYASAHTAEYKELTANIYIDWAAELRNQGHYLLALDKYDLAKKTTGSSQTLTSIGTEVQRTMLQLASDSGEDGQKILQDTMAEACYQAIPPTNPVVGSIQDEPRTILICDYSAGMQLISESPSFEPGYAQSILNAQAGTDWLPADLQATHPGNLGFIIGRIDDYDATKTCDYAGPMGLTDQFSVMRQISTVMVSDIFTAQVIAQKDFYADSPNYQCPKSKPYEKDSYYFGALVDNEKITSWVRQVVKDYLATLNK